MSDLWPSDRTSTGRASKGSKGQSVPTDWVTGWVVTLFGLALTVVVMAVLWSFVADVLASFQEVTDTIEQVTHRF